MYNAHRGLPPGPEPAGRLADLLDQVRQEFAHQANRSTEHENQRESGRSLPKERFKLEVWKQRGLRSGLYEDFASCITAEQR